MKKRLFILTALAAFCSISMMAQDDDDMYFTSSRKSSSRPAVDASKMRSTCVDITDDESPSSSGITEQPVYYSGSIRDVDEYNRRGRYTRSYHSPMDSTYYGQDSILVSRQDYENALRMQKYDGYHNKVLVVVDDPWYDDPWYYDSWYWRSRYYDPWYDPWWDPYPWGWHSAWYGPGWGWSWGWGHHSWGWGGSWAWGGWHGPGVWGHGTTWSRGGSRFSANNGRYATSNMANRSNRSSQFYSGRNNTVQRGNAFGGNNAFSGVRSYSGGTATRSNAFGGGSGAFSGGATRGGGGFSGGGAFGGGARGGGGGFSGGGHGARR